MMPFKLFTNGSKCITKAAYHHRGKRLLKAWQHKQKETQGHISVSLSNSWQNVSLWYILSSVLLKWRKATLWDTTAAFSPLLTKNCRGRGVRLTFKSWHMGRVERAAMILHADSGSPCGHHVSIYVVIQLMDECYCWVQRLLAWFQPCFISQLTVSGARTAWFRLALYFDASCIVYYLTHYLSNGWLYRAPGALMAWVFQVTCFGVMMK